MPVANSNNKIAVEAVRAIFNKKYAKENNNTFGQVVRAAFQGIKRIRDSVGYNYVPLRWRYESTVPARPEKPDKSYPTGLTQESPTKLDLLQSKNNKLEARNGELEARNGELEARNGELEARNGELEARNGELEARNGELEARNGELEDKNVELEKVAISIAKKKETLEKQVLELECKTMKLKDSITKRPRTEVLRNKVGDKRTILQASSTPVVNMISPDELFTEGDSIDIGEGSFGHCRLQTFTRTRGLVVVKEMKHTSQDSVIREARIMQAITSQRFPFIFGVQLVKEPYSIVMEFIGNHDKQQSSTLYHLVTCANEQFQLMKERDWIQVCADVAEGIGHLHSIGFLHNDLKNNNILVDKKRGYIIDLGKACDISSPPAKKYSSFYAHIAPEVLKGDHYSRESDIYSLGQIFKFVRKHCAVSKLRSLEKECININYVMRPSANIILINLNKLLL